MGADAADVDRFSRWTSIALVGVLFLTAASLGILGLDLLPLGSLREQAGAAAGDGTVDRFAAMMARVRSRALVCSGLFLGLASLALLLRPRIEAHVGRVVRSFGPAVLGARSRTRSFVGDRAQVTALLVIALLAAAVRAEHLFLPVFTDEAQTFAKSVLQPIYVGLSYHDNQNNHVLNTLLSHVSYSLLGNEPWVLRLPSYVAGVLTVPASYVLFRMHFDKDVGLFSAGLVAVSVPLVLYSSQSRGYSFVILFFLLALILSARLIRRDSPALWLLFAVVGGLGAYAMPLMLYPYGVCLVWIIASRAVDGRSIPWSDLSASVASTGLLTLYLYLPVILVSGPMSLVPHHFQSGGP